MFDRISNGWNIASQSWGVLKKDKELLIFPIISGIACIAVLITFAAPILLIPTLREMMFNLVKDEGPHKDQLPAQIIAFVLAFLYYFVNYFVIVFCNTALVGCAIIRFKGGDPTVSDGFRIASQRVPQIAGWALLSATVGMILNAIEERSEWLGQLVAGLLGTVWTAATYLVVPVLAVEGLGPIAALKRSGGLVINKWGEGLTGNFAIGLIGFLLMIPAVALIVLVSIAKLPAWVIVATVVVAALYMLTAAIVTSAAKQVFIAGLYLYAAEQRIPSAFDESTFRGDFAPKAAR